MQAAGKGKEEASPGMCHKQEEENIGKYAVGYAYTMIVEQRDPSGWWGKRKKGSVGNRSE